jgi:hypothetical protein
MADRKAFLVRLDPALHEALQRWADTDLRSLNAQIEFLLRGALRGAGRLPAQVRDQERENAPGTTQAHDKNAREK